MAVSGVAVREPIRIGNGVTEVACMPLFFLTAFTLSNSEEIRVPLPCWVNTERESFEKFCAQAALNP